MEQKKLLWIVASLGIFLLIIFLGTLILYSPNNSNNINKTMTASNNLWINPDLPVSTDKKDVATSDKNQDNIINSEEVIINAENTTVISPEDVVTIDLSTSKDTAKEKEKVVSSVKPVETVRPANSNKTERVTSVTKKEVEIPSKTESKPMVSKPVEKVAPQDQYWVQAASFTSKQNAEIAQQSLIKEKIPAEVFPYTSKKDLIYYRVRVGPYTTKSEAEYWNTLIKTFEIFENTESYVTNSSKSAN